MHLSSRIWAAIGLSLALGMPIGPTATAQTSTASDVTQKSWAAGYKALATCSATFVADRDMAVIEANQLDGIRPDLDSHLGSLSGANINERTRTVAVRFDFDLPPRLAVHRAGMGCTLLPANADPSAVNWLQTYAGLKPDTARDTSTALGDSVTLTPNVLALDRLEIPLSFAFGSSTYGEGTRTSAILIAHKGEVIAELYDRGIGADTPQRAWSASTALTSTILGAAMNDGLVGLDNEAVIEGFNRGGDPRRKITLRDLLTMSSGLESGTSGTQTDRVDYGGVAIEDVLGARALEAVPGERFKFSNYDTLIAMRYLREVLDSDRTYHRFPYTELLNTIGARSTVMETDWNGDFNSASQVWMTARDLGRIGQLYLQDGKWGEEQILHPDWVDFATKPARAQPPGSPIGYGGGFWLMGGINGIPAGTFAAMGSRGQLMAVVPEYELVIVRRGFDPLDGARFNSVAFVRDIVTVIAMVEAEQVAIRAAKIAAGMADE